MSINYFHSSFAVSKVQLCSSQFKTLRRSSQIEQMSMLASISYYPSSFFILLVGQCIFDNINGLKNFVTANTLVYPQYLRSLIVVTFILRYLSLHYISCESLKHPVCQPMYNLDRVHVRFLKFGQEKNKLQKGTCMYTIQVEEHQYSFKALYICMSTHN